LRDIALTAVFVCILPLVFKRPWVGILLIAWLGYMNPQRLAYGFAYNSFPFYKIAVLVTMLAVFMWRGRLRIPWTSETLFLLAFSLWMSFTTLSAANATASDMWGEVMKIQVSIFLTLLVISNPTELRWLVWVIALSLGFYGFKGGLFTVLNGGGDHVLGPPDSFIQDNNALALSLAMIIPLLRFLQVTNKTRWVQLALGCGMGLTVIAILGTYSRGGLIALVATCALLLLRSGRKIMFATLGVAVLFGAVKVMPQEWFDRMYTIQTYDEDASAQGRLDAWRFGLTLAKARPITGGGFRAFERSSGDLFRQYGEAGAVPRDAHSIYFKVLGEHGFPGLILFLSIGVSAVFSSSWIRKKTRNKPELAWARELATMSQISLTAYAVGGAFLGMTYFDLPYHLIVFIVLTKVFVKQKLREEKYYERDAAAVERLSVPSIPGVSSLA
jgi:probable O-glycosylation ligase (exosortase A-associated)